MSDYEPRDQLTGNFCIVNDALSIAFESLKPDEIAEVKAAIESIRQLARIGFTWVNGSSKAAEE